MHTEYKKRIMHKKHKQILQKINMIVDLCSVHCTMYMIIVKKEVNWRNISSKYVQIIILSLSPHTEGRNKIPSGWLFN